MKLNVLISSLLFILISGIGITGFLTDPVTVINKKIVIEAPEPVIWNNLLHLENYGQWCAQSKFNKVESDSQRNRYYRSAEYKFGGNRIEILEEISIDASNNSISIIPAKKDPVSYSANFHTLISMGNLADGSTEVSWKTTYTVPPLLARVINRFAMKPLLTAFMTRSLDKLKHTIE